MTQLSDLYGATVVLPVAASYVVSVRRPWYVELWYGALRVAGVLVQALLFALAWTLMTEPFWNR